MKCTIPGINVKIFGRAIHSLSKIGEELYLEPLEKGLAVRSVNSSRSAYACFLFAPSFFHQYDDGSPIENTQSSEEEALRCKVGMKSCLTIFKSMSTIEKTVERCIIEMNFVESRLVFQLHCKHGIVKTHNLAFIECETLQAVFSKDMCVNKLTAPSRLLSEAVVNFQNNQEEITLIASPEKICLKNYIDDEPDPNKVMLTVLNLEPDEFIHSQIGVDTDITFCLKELRAILNFAEVTGMPINIHFETPGRPVVFGIDNDTNYEANFVLATLAEPSATQPVSCSQINTTSFQQSKSFHNSKSVHAQQKNKSKPKERAEPSKHSIRERNNRNDTAFVSVMDDDADDDVDTGRVTHSSTSRQESKVKRTLATSPVPSTSKEHGGHLHPMETEREAGEESSFQFLGGGDAAEDDDFVIGSEEENDTMVEGTPPAKKFRSLFFGTSQSTQASQSQAVPRLVLAADTDDESS